MQVIIHSFIAVFGNIAATGIAAVSLILLSRILAPADFGVFSVVVALGLMLSRFVDGGGNIALNSVVSREKKEDKKRGFFLEAIKIKLALSIVVSFVVVLFASTLADMLKFSSSSYVYFAILLSQGVVWYELLHVMLQSLQRVPQTVLINAIQAAVKLLGVVIFFLVLRSTAGAAIDVQVKTLFPVILFGVAPLLPWLFWKFLLPGWVTLSSPEKFPKLRAQLFQFMKHSSFAYITTGVVENIDVLFVKGYLNEYETGLFSGAWRIAAFIILAGYSLGSVLNPWVAKLQTTAELKKYFWQSSLLLGAVLGAFLLVLPFAKFLIIFTIGEQYIQSTPVLLILLASAFLYVATIPFIALFYNFSAHWYFSISGILQLLIIVLGNWWFVPEYGLMGAGVTRLSSQLFAFLFTLAVSAWYLFIFLQREHTTFAERK